jgi:hypothetical protein
MQIASVSVGIYSACMQAERKSGNMNKPSFSMAKTKEKLAEFFNRNEQVRTLCDENKVGYPRMHQSVQDTAWRLLMYYIKNWGKSVAQNYEIRITYSYLKRALNDSCCVATLKNHINKLLKMYKGFLVAKTRGGLGLESQNTACIVLELSPEVLQFENDRHNQAVAIGQLSAEEARRIAQETHQKERTASGGILNGKAATEAAAQKRQQTPSSIASIFSSAFSDILKKE